MKVKKDEKNTRIEKIPQIDYNSIAMIKPNTDIQQIHDKFFHKVAYTNDIEAIREIFRYWHEKGSTENKDVILFFMRYISQTQDIRPDRLKEMLDKSKIDGGELMPTLAQQFKEEFMETLGPQLKEEGIKIGVKKGVKKGVEKGEKNKAIETAKKMINKGFDIDTIVELTGLGKEEVTKLSSSTTH